MSRRFPAPPSISSAAQSFINAAAPLTTINMEPNALAATRRELYSLNAPPGREIQKSLELIVEDGEVAGIPVKWMIPRKFQHPEIILYFFGGGHVTGSPDEDLTITARLAHFTGRKVCAPVYRLAPKHPYPAALEDATAVYKALQQKHGPKSLAVSGESAGGNLALALIAAAAAQGLALPSALALLSPWCDLTHSGDTIRTLDGIDPSLDLDHQLMHMANAYAGGQPLTSPGISPLFADVPNGFPPTIITTGTRDVLLSDCARLSAKLRKAGVEVDLRVSEGMWHVFEYYGHLPEAEASMNGIAAFLHQHLPAA